MKDVFLGELPQDTSAGTPPGGYDSSGVNPDLPVKEVIIEEEEETVSSNNWIMYLGVGIMAYVLLFRKK